MNERSEEARTSDNLPEVEDTRIDTSRDREHHSFDVKARLAEARDHLDFEAVRAIEAELEPIKERESFLPVSVITLLTGRVCPV